VPTLAGRFPDDAQGFKRGQRAQNGRQ
jgi:hypothetical protein